MRSHGLQNFYDRRLRLQADDRQVDRLRAVAACLRVPNILGSRFFVML